MLTHINRYFLRVLLLNVNIEKIILFVGTIKLQLSGVNFDGSLIMCKMVYQQFITTIVKRYISRIDGTMTCLQYQTHINTNEIFPGNCTYCL